MRGVFQKTGRNLKTNIYCEVKNKISPITGPRCPEGSRKLRFPDYVTMTQDGGKVVSLTHRPLLPPGNTPGTHFCQRLRRPQGHSAIGRIMSMKRTNETIWNRTSDFPISSTALQPLRYRGPLIVRLPCVIQLDSNLFCIRHLVISSTESSLSVCISNSFQYPPLFSIL